MAKYGEMLREARQKAGMSIRDVARRAGLSEAHLRFIEKGERDTKVRNLRRLAMVLGVDEGPLINAWFEENLPDFDYARIMENLPRGISFRDLEEMYLVDDAKKVLAEIQDLSLSQLKSLSPGRIMKIKRALQNTLGLIRELEMVQ